MIKRELAWPVPCALGFSHSKKGGCEISTQPGLRKDSQLTLNASSVLVALVSLVYLLPQNLVTGTELHGCYLMSG